MSYSPIQYAPTLDTVELSAPAVPTCACGETLYNGACFNVGACETADRGATKLARGEGIKSRLAPRAFTLGGRVD